MKDKPYLEKTEYELAVEGLKAAIQKTKAKNRKLKKIKEVPDTDYNRTIRGLKAALEDVKARTKKIEAKNLQKQCPAKRKKKLTIEGFTKAKRD